MENEAFTVTLEVIVALDHLKIPYLIGGSLASTLHGFARTTLDSDLVADIRRSMYRSWCNNWATATTSPTSRCWNGIVSAAKCPTGSGVIFWG